MDYKTIHIFNFDLVQFIGSDFNHKLKKEDISRLQTFLDYVGVEDFHVIHIFKDMFIRILKEGEENTDIPWDDIDSEKLNNLVEDIENQITINEA